MNTDANKITPVANQASQADKKNDSLSQLAHQISSVLDLPVKVYDNADKGDMVINLGSGNEKHSRKIYELLFYSARLPCGIAKETDDGVKKCSIKDQPRPGEHFILLHTQEWPSNWNMKLTFRSMYTTETPAKCINDISQMIEEKDAPEPTNS